ncbi:Bacteriophage abortive infection AbiH [Prevotellaceae bacterium HUN156]|nr:Bacteriophage abortive infection AbiH [Prevotellaceae bacterium HUN156]
MNRLVLIGNGFDLAHGLKTSYADFINWYWEDWGRRLLHGLSRSESDELCSFTIKDNIGAYNWAFVWGSLYQRTDITKPWDVNLVVNLAKQNKELCDLKMSPFLERIIKSVETMGWVDIENEYYDLLKHYALNNDNDFEVVKLNKRLHCLQEKLVEYLSQIDILDNLLNTGIRQKIYAPIIIQDISIEGQQALKEHVEYGLKLDKWSLDMKLRQYGSMCYSSGSVEGCLKNMRKTKLQFDELPDELFLPNHIMLLNFNYTHTAQLYLKDGSIFTVNQIHGDLSNPSSVIFGYGDELDSDYKKIVNKNDNRFLANVKSIKYLESDNYRKVLSFIESDPYQVIVMGHSCGNSDRTLLNTLFEHKNCVSIKPYYHQIDKDHDDYIKIVQNISRNFTDMKLMRDRVVNKEYCEPFSDDSKKKTD